MIGLSLARGRRGLDGAHQNPAAGPNRHEPAKPRRGPGWDRAAGIAPSTPHASASTTEQRRDELGELLLEEGHCDQLRLLLDGHTDDIEAPDAWGNTPLWLAIYHHHHGSTIAQMLIAHRADPHIENCHGITALRLAHALATDDAAVAALLPLLSAATRR